VKATDDQLTDIVDRIVDAAHPVRIVMFGSAARGEAGPESDIDILVVVEDGVHRRRTMGDIYKRLLGSHLDVDVVVATLSDVAEYADTPGLIYREALEQGVQLYAA
jgi:uncharacterized protein